MVKNRKLVAPDIYALVTVIALVVLGVWLVFDASYAKAGDLRSMNYDVYFMLKKQAIFALIGICCLWIVSLFSFDRLRQMTIPILAISASLLVVVLAMGHTAHGATSWFRFGQFFMQPSELAKIAIVLYLASALSLPRVFKRRAPRTWTTPAFVCAGFIGLIVLERDLGTATLLGLLCLAIFFAAGAKKRYVLLISILAFVAVAGAMVTLPHCKARMRAFMDPWKYRFDEGYQTVHSLSGLGTGGIKGVNLCEGREKYYLPAASTDYIFSTLGEETGLAGCLILLGGFIFFTSRGLHIAHKSSSKYGSLLSTGVTSLICLQALVNVAVVSSSIPATGLPLPFISYGGSSLVTTLICVGILLSASRQVSVAPEERDEYESSTSRRGHGRSHISGGERRSGASGYRSSRRTAVRR